MFLFIVTPIDGVCNCSMVCCTLHYVPSSIAIILVGKRELDAMLNLSKSRANIWYHKNAFKPPRWLRLLSVLRRHVVLLLTLFIVTPTVGVCNCSMFRCMSLYVDSSFAIILMGKRELVVLLI